MLQLWCSAKVAESVNANDATNSFDCFVKYIKEAENHKMVLDGAKCIMYSWNACFRVFPALNWYKLFNT